MFLEMVSELNDGASIPEMLKFDEKKAKFLLLNWEDKGKIIDIFKFDIKKQYQFLLYLGTTLWLYNFSDKEVIALLWWVALPHIFKWIFKAPSLLREIKTKTIDTGILLNKISLSNDKYWFDKFAKKLIDYCGDNNLLINTYIRKKRTNRLWYNTTDLEKSKSNVIMYVKEDYNGEESQILDMLQSFLHELSHSVYHSLPKEGKDSIKPVYTLISSLESIETDWTKKTTQSLKEEYWLYDEEEFFAEFLSNPILQWKIKELDPKIFNYFKKTVNEAIWVEDFFVEYENYNEIETVEL